MARWLFQTVMLIIGLGGSCNCGVFASLEAHPGYEPGICEVGIGSSREKGRILDISHAYREQMPIWESSEGLGHFLWLASSMKNGSLANNSEMKMPTHTGTHVDAPGHVYQEYYEAGFDVDTLDLQVLNGHALLVDVPRDTNITAKVMEALNIPKGVRRVLFRTLNTDSCMPGKHYKVQFQESTWRAIERLGLFHSDLCGPITPNSINGARRLMWKQEFDASYVGFMKDGAQWLVDNTDIKLVGIDYLSVAAYDHLIPSHLVLLKNKDIILVEGLKLDDIEPGLYSLHCLPLRLLGAEGSPIRCILIE